MDENDKKEQVLFDNFGFHVLDEEVSRLFQAREYLRDFQEDPGSEEYRHWIQEIDRIVARIKRLTNAYASNDWHGVMKVFMTRNEYNYTFLGQFAKAYRFMFNERLPFDED